MPKSVPSIRVPSGAEYAGPNPTGRRWCPLLRLSVSARTLFFPLSTGGKLSSTDININIKAQLQTIILSQWHTSRSQRRGINLISRGCLRSGFQARGRRAFSGKNKLTVTSLRCNCRVVRASPWLDLKACLPWKRTLFMCVELYGFNKKVRLILSSLCLLSLVKV